MHGLGYTLRCTELIRRDLQFVHPVLRGPGQRAFRRAAVVVVDGYDDEETLLQFERVAESNVYT